MQIPPTVPLSPLSRRTCWVVSEGMAGTENQCIGVAEALGMQVVIKRIGLRQPWKTLAPWLGAVGSWSFDPARDVPAAPWPDVALCNGRKAAAAARYIRRASRGRCFVVQLQNPYISPAHFDLVAAPQHDGLRGANVVSTVATPNKITPEGLTAARVRFAPLFSGLTVPRIAVLVGGGSHTHRFTPETNQRMVQSLKALQDGHGLMLTLSRRSDPALAGLLRDALPDAFIWDGTGGNPYLGMLAWADTIIVTSDSASMLSEAATTGKPVYMLRIEGGSRKFDRLYDNLYRRGAVRDLPPAGGPLEHWTYDRLDDAGLVADAIRARRPLIFAD